MSNKKMGYVIQMLTMQS